MIKDLRLIIVNHLGVILLSIAMVIAIYFISVQVIDKSNKATSNTAIISDMIGSNTSKTFDNTTLSGSQVLSTIKKYYDSDVIILLLNNSDDYNKASFRFWVTGKGGKYGQNTNYESIIISRDLNTVNYLIVQEKSINSKYTKASLNSYSDSNSKNYINLGSKYKSILLKCNGYTVGIAFLAI